MPQDYVIVFGAAVGADGRPSAVLRHRLEAAADWARGRSNARILVTGGLGRHPPAEAEVMRRYLLERGLEENAILAEPEASDTFASALNCIEILRRQSDVRSIRLCSSSFHLPRCGLIFRVLGVTAGKVEIESDRRVLGPGRWLRASLREVPATVWDVILALGHRWMRGAALTPRGRSD